MILIKGDQQLADKTNQVRKILRWLIYLVSEIDILLIVQIRISFFTIVLILFKSHFTYFKYFSCTKTSQYKRRVIVLLAVRMMTVYSPPLNTYCSLYTYKPNLASTYLLLLCFHYVFVLLCIKEISYLSIVNQTLSNALNHQKISTILVAAEKKLSCTHNPPVLFCMFSEDLKHYLMRLIFYIPNPSSRPSLRFKLLIAVL